MAIWQFKFLLVPTEWAEKNADRITHQLVDDGCELSAAWRESALQATAETVIDRHMPRAHSWYTETTIWGDEATDDVQLWREAGEIADLRIRIDTRKDYDSMVQHSVSIARSLN